MVEKDRQPIDVLTKDIYPYPLNVPEQERKAFAMLTLFLEGPEKDLVTRRPGHNLLRVSKDGKVNYMSPTAWEWKRVLGFQVGDMNGSGPHEWERIDLLNRCLDRNICTWLASLTFS